MAGELVPLVLLPRYTTYAGLISAEFFTTIAMDVTQYESAIVNFWRGKIVGTAGSPHLFIVKFEESTDQVSWTECAGSPDGSTITYPVENVEKQYTLELKKRWFRIKVQLGNADNIASCWAVGFLEERLR
jgi:hypothetical protein